MALTIGTTSVISQSRQLQNIASLDSTTETTIGNAVTGAGYTKVWVRFVGTGTISISGDANVTSLTDNGTGDYSINFSSALTDVNYAANTSGGGVGDDVVNATPKSLSTPTTTQLRVQLRRVGSVLDIPNVSVTVNR